MWERERKVYKAVWTYMEVYEGIEEYMNPLFRHCFFRLFGGPLFRHCSFLSYLVLFGLICLYLVLFYLIWFYFVLFGLILSYLVLFGFIQSYLVLFGLIWSYLVLSWLIWFYFDFIWPYLVLFDLIQVPIKPKKGPGRRHLTCDWLCSASVELPILWRLALMIFQQLY